MNTEPMLVEGLDLNPTELAQRIACGQIEPNILHLRVFAPNEPKVINYGSGMMAARINGFACQRVKGLAKLHLAKLRLANHVDKMTIGCLKASDSVMELTKQLTSAQTNMALLVQTLNVIDAQMTGNEHYEHAWVNYPTEPEETPATAVRKAIAATKEATS